VCAITESGAAVYTAHAKRMETLPTHINFWKPQVQNLLRTLTVTLLTVTGLTVDDRCSLTCCSILHTLYAAVLSPTTAMGVCLTRLTAITAARTNDST
jgi:hypothetical protein